MNKMIHLKDLFLEQLNEIYSAELKLLDALPKLAVKVTSEKLERLLEFHLEETRNHVARLEGAFALLEETPAHEPWEAVEGLLSEEEAIRCADAEPAVKDAAIICAAQKIEHFEIACYGCLKAYAELLGYTEIIPLICANLD